MRALAFASLLLGLGGCAYDFQSICLEGEVCDPDSLPVPPTAEPMIGQVAACRVLLGTCPGSSAPMACHFVISGGAVDEAPECRGAAGSASRDQSCSDTMGCAVGLTCVRPSTAEPGICRDLCTTLDDCTSSTRSNQSLICDRSRLIANLGGVPIYACAPVNDDPRTSR